MKPLPWWLKGNSAIWCPSQWPGGKTRPNDMWPPDAASRIGLSELCTTSSVISRTWPINLRRWTLQSQTRASTFPLTCLSQRVEAPWSSHPEKKTPPKSNDVKSRNTVIKMKYRNLAWSKSFVPILLVGFTLPKFRPRFQPGWPHIETCATWLVSIELCDSEESKKIYNLWMVTYGWVTSSYLFEDMVTSFTFQLTKGPMLKVKGLHSRLSCTDSVHSWVWNSAVRHWTSSWGICGDSKVISQMISVKL